jgi:hypothetical protein
MALLDEFFPFDLGNGAPANTARWRKMAQLWAPDGILANYLNQLNATLAGTTVTVQSGGLFLHGYYGEVQNPQTITGVGTNGTVVAGADLVNQNVSIYYRDQVVDYGSNPATNYEQDANKWEMPLWLVSGTTLVDLRNLFTSGMGMGWWNSAPGPVSVGTGTTSQMNILTSRVPYTTWAMLNGTLLVTFTDASQAQTAICQLTYQFGQSDQQTSPTITPSIPGAGPAGGQLAIPVGLSALIPTTQGKKTLGWRVTAGTPGPQISVTSMTLGLTLVARPPAA